MEEKEPGITEEIAKAIRNSREIKHAGNSLENGAACANFAAYVTALMRKDGRQESPIEKGAYLGYISESIENPTLKGQLLRSVGDYWMELCDNVFSKLPADDLLAFALEYDSTTQFGSPRSEHSTPASVSRLALSIMRPRRGDSLVDLACGVGSFLAAAHEDTPGLELHGSDVNVDAACLAMVRSAILGADAEIDVEDSLVAPHNGQYEYAFADFLLGVRAASLRGRNGYYYDMVRSVQHMPRPVSADWVFARAAYDSVRPGGTAVVTMGAGATVNGGDEKTRKYFVDGSMVKAVIALPGGLYRGTAIPIALLVLGEGGNGVRMVDASDLGTAERRRTLLDDGDLEEIVSRLEEDGEHSRLVPQEEIVAASYRLDPGKYLGRDLGLENATKLRDLAMTIRRGGNISARELDEIATDEDTKTWYLTPADISDGRVAAELAGLRDAGRSSEKHRVRNGDLLVTRMAPFKVAVAELPDDRTVVASGNVYAVTLDTEHIDPYFAAAFLVSRDGRESLDRASAGTAIKNIPMSALGDIELPVPPMDIQEKAATEYRTRVDEIAVLASRIEKARIAARSAYDEAVER